MLKTCPLVENICIYGDSSKSYVVALIVPDRNKLTELAKKLGKAETEFDLLRKDKDVTGAVLRELVMYGRQLRLEKFEQPGAVTVCDELWTPGRKRTISSLQRSLQFLIIFVRHGARYCSFQVEEETSTDFLPGRHQPNVRSVII